MGQDVIPEAMSWRSFALLVGSSLAVGGATYFIYSRAKKKFAGTECKSASLTSKKGSASSSDRSSSSTSSPSSSSHSAVTSKPSTDRQAKKILVLGLKGAGKSSLLQCLTRGGVEHRPAPTAGFNVVQCRIPAYAESDAERQRDTPVSPSSSSAPLFLDLDLWEIGGDDAFRKFWSNFLSETDCLLFLIDPGADARIFGEAAEELARAAGDYRMGAVPIVVLATHQDRRPSQIEPKELRRLLVEVGISPQILARIYSVATPPPPTAPSMVEMTPRRDDIRELSYSGTSGVEELKVLLSKIL